MPSYPIEMDITNIFVFYLIITSNFFVPLLPCRVQAAVGGSILLRHFLGLLTMTFFVVLANKGDAEIAFWKILGLSLLFYTWFVASTKMNTTTWFFLILLLATLYLLKLYKENSVPILTEEEKERLETAEKTLFWTAAATTVFGVLLYIGEKKIEYKDTFNYPRFFVGKVDCKGESPAVSWGRALRALWK